MKKQYSAVRPISILMVEDNPDDVQLTIEALNGWKLSNEMSVVKDGEEALRFLRNEGEFEGAARPDLILLDLNMPRMDGRELLAQIKVDEELKVIPVVILTTSEAEEDILRAYKMHANCYITKPVDLDQFSKVVKVIDQFWFTVVKLP